MLARCTDLNDISGAAAASAKVLTTTAKSAVTPAVTIETVRLGFHFFLSGGGGGRGWGRGGRGGGVYTFHAWP